MFGDVQHTIRDAQYRHALKRVKDGPPETSFPVPTIVELKQFKKKHNVCLELILDSPIGVYFFKRYLNRFLNVAIIVDFLVQYQRVKVLETPEILDLEELLEFAAELPSPYQGLVSRIKKQLKILQRNNNCMNSEFEGTIDNEMQTEGISGYEEMNTLTEIENQGPQPQPMRPMGAGTAQILTKIKFNGKGNRHAEKVVSFGGMPKNYRTPFSDDLDDEDEPAAHGIRKKIRAIFRRPGRIISAVDFDAEDKENPQKNIIPVDQQSVAMSGDDLAIDSSYDPVEEALRNQRSARDTLLDMFHELGEVCHRKGSNLFKSFEASKEYEKMCDYLWVADRPLTPSDFRRFRILGKGAFGVVSGVKNLETGQLTAMKMMNKKVVKGKGAMRLINTEKEVLQILGDNPSSFTIWLKYAFQDDDYFYIAIPLCTGGDLSYHLKRTGTFSAEATKFYAAEIFDGLAHMHRLGILYRDLKPENVILDSDGHCRLSDMGLAAVTHGTRIRSRAGTPGYWAPEVMTKLFYSYPADYWSFGVVMFEFLIGVCPFSATNTGMARNKATRKWPIQYPSHVKLPNSKEQVPFPADAMKLLMNILRRRASKRFTEDEIRSHEYFKDIIWEKLRERQVTPPFIPSDQEINAGASRKLEDYSDEKKFKYQKMTKDDEIPDFDYTSKYAHELDIVNVLTMKKTKVKEKNLSKSKSKASSSKPIARRASLVMLGTLKGKLTLKSKDNLGG